MFCTETLRNAGTGIRSNNNSTTCSPRSNTNKNKINNSNCCGNHVELPSQQTEDDEKKQDDNNNSSINSIQPRKLTKHLHHQDIDANNNAQNAESCGNYAHNASCVDFQQSIHAMTLTRTLAMVSQLSQIRVDLELKQLWDEFHQFGTEMIVTKAGR